MKQHVNIKKFYGHSESAIHHSQSGVYCTYRILLKCTRSNKDEQ